MGRQSSIDRLPPKIREALNEWLRDPQITQAQAVERTADLVAELNDGLPEDQRIEAPSKSAVNRYAVRMEQVGEKLRQSREIADMWIARIGAQPQGQLGNLVNEMLRTLAFDLALKLQEGELTAGTMPGVIDQLKELSLSVTRLEKASSENVKREAEIRRQEREKAAEEAAERASSTAKRYGLGEQTVAEIRREILGVAE